MLTKTLVPDTVISSSNLSGTTVANLSADDANWATAMFTNAPGFVRVGFPTPPGLLVTGVGIQTFNARVRMHGPSFSPTARLELWQTDGATPLAQGADVAVNGLDQLISLNWNAALLAAISGAEVEALVRFTSTGGGGQSTAVDVGYIEWVAAYNPSRATRCSYVL